MSALSAIKTVCDDNFEVQFEVVPAITPNDRTDSRRTAIAAGIKSADSELDIFSARLNELNQDIDRLTNHADGIDYMVAVGSGVIAGIIDLLFVEDLSLETANEWGNEKTNNFVVRIAQSQGYEGDDLPGAVNFLEKKYPIAADKATNAFGGGSRHHLNDFSHHPTLIGLFFSMLTQFTHKVYGTDTFGAFKIAELQPEHLVLIGNTVPEKLLLGLVNWIFHLVSDMSGSYNSVLEGKTGTGLPGPIVSLLKELSALPIFHDMDQDGYKDFSKLLSDVFSGDSNRPSNSLTKFDLRTELGIAQQLTKQSLPVVINECIVRGFYFIRHFITEIKEKEIHSFKDLNRINWENVLPRKNRTIARMLTISTGTMTAIDLADAAIESAIKSGGVSAPEFIRNMIVKVNIVGLGRFAVAVGTDISMGCKRRKAIMERSDVTMQIVAHTTTKLYYLEADYLCTLADVYEQLAKLYHAENDLWIEVINATHSMNELYLQAEKVGTFYSKTLPALDDSFNRIEQLLPDVEKANPGLTAELLRRLK